MVGARKEVAEENSFYSMSLFGTCQIKAYPYSQGLKKILCQEKAFDFPDTLKLEESCCLGECIQIDRHVNRRHPSLKDSGFCTLQMIS